MSWREGQSARSLALACLVALALPLGACGFRPLYAERGDGSSVRAELQQVHVREPATRLEQQFRNALLYDFGQIDATEREEALYDLSYTLAPSTRPALVSRSGDIRSQTYVLTVRYELQRRGETGAPYRGSAVSEVPYDLTDQPFANERAEIDAQDRAAEGAARQVEAQIAAYLATRS